MPREPLTTIRQLELMRDLQRLANERFEEEERLQARLKQSLAEAQQKLNDKQQAINEEWEETRKLAGARFEEEHTAEASSYEAGRKSMQGEYQGLRGDVESQHAAETKNALLNQQEAAWETWAMFDATKDGPKQRMHEAFGRLSRSQLELAVLQRDAVAIMKMRNMRLPELADNSEPSNGQAAGDESGSAVGEDLAQAATLDAEAAAANVEKLTQTARQAALNLFHQKLPQLYEDWHPFAAFAILAALLAIPCGVLLGWNSWVWIVVALGGGLVGCGALLAAVYPLARRGAAAQYTEVLSKLDLARDAIGVAVVAARRRGFHEADSLLKSRDSELTAAHQDFFTKANAQDDWKNAELGEANSFYPARLAQLREGHQEQMTGVEGQYRTAMAEATKRRDSLLAVDQTDFDQHRERLESDHQEAWKLMANRWFTGLDRIRSAWGDMDATCERLFPDWNSTDFSDWPKPEAAPESIRYGTATLDLKSVKHGLSTDPQLLPDETKFILPALMSLEEHPVFVIEAEGEAREKAVEILQHMMLRMLTAIPPGKARFTIIDPVGLGENFASFMHLADYDERIIASRIWTEPKHINEQLVRLTTHMETILQKYLRNEFATIHEYNEYAGEVAEPFQVFVATDFPANFSDETIRRLISVASSGPRCGVYTLLAIDRSRRLPSDFRLDDLLEHAVHLQWDSQLNRFRWRYPAFEHLPLAIDPPPRDDRFVDVVRGAGLAAKQAIRVEVPFKVVAPKEEDIWKSECSKELVVPIGRAGATRLQSVRLGKGTSQHMLICGKTGSGKSTLLHALITNAALLYSPDEVELYLIDFKKGVEFKCYAAGRLPHAKVIAIESEREFGLSVLERLDQELRRRGDLLRAAAVQDLAGYRKAFPDESMPRVLLIIDEFQEFFVEDDKLGQDAGLLLDRLIRQGRAFGMHVLLGSQTLSGAYSLPRSTMGQMAVRVALQCSEADAHLIMTDERNSAARYLSRPGEAIYNDQNGLLTGNSPFQVVWLDEQERNDYLAVAEQMQEKVGHYYPPPIVFEGNAPAKLASNPLVSKLLESPPTSPPAEQQAWLGSAIAIKDPTCATFGRHAGSNLLVVGHREESAMGVLTSAVASLAVQAGSKDNPSRFFILDGTRPESLEVDTWKRVCEKLPINAEVVGLRGVAKAIGEVAEELHRRESVSENGASDEEQPPWFLIIHSGGRFRELRRNEDDFSFSSKSDKQSTPDQQLADILRNGPAWGIHLMLWCDSLNNVMRMFDRLTLREFEMRVVFQMSAADSSSLLDSPAASKLRVHRGLFYSDELGTAEKFRPYGSSSDEWLEQVAESLGNSTPR